MGDLASLAARLGRSELALPHLRRTAEQEPLHEAVHAALMVALASTGRQAEAFRTYQVIRHRLSDELGVDPSDLLNTAYHRVLHHEFTVSEGGTVDQRPTGPLSGEPTSPPAGHGSRGAAPPADTSAPVTEREGEPARLSTTLDQDRPNGPPPVVPAQLPPDVWGFAGRRRELQVMDGIRAAAAEQSTAAVIMVVSGPAGVGKTALAVHWAQRVRPDHPDGQLYLNLRGDEPGGQALTSTEVVRALLDAWGVPPQRIPAEPDAQIGLYRSLLADRRLLLVLDNARDADHVRTLLPGSPGCTVVVTSRNPLASLVATRGAHAVTLDVLDPSEARELLAGRLGADRLAAEPEAVDEIVAASARLPLALAIVAARAAVHPGFPLASLARELHDAEPALDAFDAGDPTTNIRTVLSGSYRGLSTEAARLFRQLGTQPGPDIAAPAAASLVGVPVPRVRALLGELERTHLVVEHVPGRFTFHDLLRAYAGELARSTDSDDVRRAAQHRVLDHYLHTAHRAALLVNPHRCPLELPGPRPGVTPEHLAGYGPAMAWFATERPVLLAGIHAAAQAGFDKYAWRLAWTLTDFLNLSSHWQDWFATQQVAIDAAGRVGDRLGQAHAHRSLARAGVHLGQYEAVHEHLEHLHRALGLFGEIDDDAGQARTYLDLGSACARQGRFREALEHDEKALQLSRMTGDRTGQARALGAIGWHHAQLGEYHQAITACRQALAMNQPARSLNIEAAAWDSLGYAHQHRAEYGHATACFQQAINLYGQIGDRYGRADVLSHLGDTYQAAGDPGAARGIWRDALATFEELDHTAASQVRAKLHNLEPA